MSLQIGARCWHNERVTCRRSIFIVLSMAVVAIGLAQTGLAQSGSAQTGSTQTGFSQTDFSVSELYPEPYPVWVAAETEILVPPVELSTAWIELTPMASDVEPKVIRLGDRAIDDGELLLRTGLPPGPAMMCTGASSMAVTCESIYVERDVVAESTPLLAVDVRFEEGLEVVGRYLLDEWPVAGARIAVVPVDIEGSRPYTMPLGMGEKVSAGLNREVLTGEDGRFIVPPLAAGEYFLETILPSGRVHRSESFVVPEVSGLRFSLAVDELSIVSWDLGDIDVFDGLSLQVLVSDPDGVPIPGARVAARQGGTAFDLVSFEGTSGAEGEVWLSGFTVDHSVHLSCQAPGFAPFEADYELVPVVVECVLDPLATVLGEIVGPGGEAMQGAVVTMAPATPDDERSKREEMAVPADSGSTFVITDLPAGDWLMTVAAPGYEIFDVPLTLAAGEHLDLGTLVLLSGTELEGLVIDATSHESIAGAEILGIDPLGSTWAVSDSDGAFTATVSSDRTVGLEVSAAGYAPSLIWVSPELTGAGDPLVVELSEAGWLRIVIWDAVTDSPCQGCPVMIAPTGARLRTDRWGEAVSGPLAAGWYNVYRPRVTHLGSAVVEQADAERRSGKVEPGEITTVQFGDNHDALHVVLEPPAESGWRLSARTPWRVENAEAREDGSFMVHRRPGEALELFLVFHDEAAEATSEIWQASVAADLDSDEIVIPLGRSSVTGRVVSAGEPVVGERVRLRSLTQKVIATTHTRPDGTFHLPWVQTGVYFVAIGSPNLRTISLRDGESLDAGTFEFLASGL